MERQNSDQPFLRGMEKFNRRNFFGAHETWEEIWQRASGRQRTFLQGLIQIAAAFHHYQRGNLAGTLSLLRAGGKRLANFSANHCGIQLDELRGKITRWIEQLDSGGQPASEELPRIERARSHRGETQ